MLPKLYTLQGNPNLDPSRMNSVEAGLHFLRTIAEIHPGITWGELAVLTMRPELMRGWWTSLKRSVGDIKDGIGDVLKDTGSFIGSSVGSAVRLVTDEKVMTGVSRGAAAYASGGSTEAAADIFGKGNASEGLDVLATLGDAWKTITGQSKLPSQAPARAGLSWVNLALISSAVLAGIWVTRPKRKGA